MIYACMGCKKRYPGCHGVCEEYAKDMDKNEQKKAKIRKARKEEDDYFRTIHYTRKNKGKMR